MSAHEPPTTGNVHRKYCTCRLLPSTLVRLKSGARTHGFLNKYSFYAEALLLRGANTLQQRSMVSSIALEQGKAPSRTSIPNAKRQRHRTVTLLISESLWQLYRMASVSLGYARYSDLVEEVLIRQLAIDERRPKPTEPVPKVQVQRSAAKRSPSPRRRR